MKLSILICSIPSRSFKLQLLVEHLNKQIGFEAVEVLVEVDNKVMTIGAKRQLLLERATGDYVVSIDDDDWVPDYYIQQLLHAIKAKPDCIGFRISCDMQGVRKTANSSNKYSDWKDNTDGFNYVRTIYHKNPVKREIALHIGYNKNMRFGEDYDYSKRLKASGLLINETYLSLIMYNYRYAYENPKTKYGMN